MKIVSHRFMAVVLAASLCVCSSMTAGPRERGPRDRDTPKIVKIIKKLFGIGSNEDLPIPPHP